MLAKSMKGEEIARELIHLQSTEYAIDSIHLLAAMHDRASVNDAAMRIVKVISPNLLDVGCFLHILDLVVVHLYIRYCCWLDSRMDVVDVYSLNSVSICDSVSSWALY